MSQSEPHTNHSYKKIYVLMYVCMNVAICRPRAYHIRMYACTCIIRIGKDRQCRPRIKLKCSCSAWIVNRASYITGRLLYNRTTGCITGYPVDQFSILRPVTQPDRDLAILIYNWTNPDM